MTTTSSEQGPGTPTPAGVPAAPRPHAGGPGAGNSLMWEYVVAAGLPGRSR